MAKKLYHWCTECKNIVAKKKSEPFGFPIDCKHDQSTWVRMYMEVSSDGKKQQDEERTEGDG